MKLSDNQQAFMALIRAGLWESDVRLIPYGLISYQNIYQLAVEQSMVGLIAAGVEHVVDVKIPQDVALLFAGAVLQIEQRNMAMNRLIELLINELDKNGICPVLIKGQGVAQCYANPSWRTSGDIDLLVKKREYQKAKSLLSGKANKIEEEDKMRLHIAMYIGSWEIELHGTVYSGISKRIDSQLDLIQVNTFEEKSFRWWQNGTSTVSIPSPNNDVIFVFSHILQHFYNGGIGLRQICDWCRLIWTYHSEIDINMLKKRLETMGIVNEWMAFSTFAVKWLGMPAEKLPIYSSKKKWSKKADFILSYILMTGNFGHNRDNSYQQKKHFVIRKAISFWINTRDAFRLFCIFPKNAFRVWVRMIKAGF